MRSKKDILSGADKIIIYIVNRLSDNENICRCKILSEKYIETFQSKSQPILRKWLERNIPKRVAF